MHDIIFTKISLVKLVANYNLFIGRIFQASITWHLRRQRILEGHSYDAVLQWRQPVSTGSPLIAFIAVALISLFAGRFVFDRQTNCRSRML